MAPRLAPTQLIKRDTRVAVILNAHAKRVNSRVRASFARLVPSEDLFFSRSLEEAATIAQTIIERRYGTVMLGGGDGTIAMTLDLLLKAAEQLAPAGAAHALPAVAVLRLGTGNGLGHLSGAGKPLEDAMRLLSEEVAPSQPLRILKDAVTGAVTPFGSMGYDAQVLNDHVDVVQQTRTRIGRSLAKSLGGYFYALGTRTLLAELRAQPSSITLTARG
ncbi:MAG: diacylglycerol kinase family protein, partial [Myxococcota bacterium]